MAIAAAATMPAAIRTDPVTPSFVATVTMRPAAILTTARAPSIRSPLRTRDSTGKILTRYPGAGEIILSAPVENWTVVPLEK